MDILKAPLLPHHLGYKSDDTHMFRRVADYVASQQKLGRGEVVTVGHLLDVIRSEGMVEDFAQRMTMPECGQDMDRLVRAINKLFARAERQQQETQARYDGEAPTYTQMGDTYVGDGVERQPFYPTDK